MRHGEHKFIEKVIAHVRIQVRVNNVFKGLYHCRHQTQKGKLTLTLHKQKANMLTETSIHFSPDFISRYFWMWIFFRTKIKAQEKSTLTIMVGWWGVIMGWDDLITLWFIGHLIHKYLAKILKSPVFWWFLNWPLLVFVVWMIVGLVIQFMNWQTGSLMKQLQEVV